MVIEKIVVGEFETNCYIVGCEKIKKAIIIDPGDEYEKISKLLAKLNLTPEIIINTHGHIDHIGVNDKFNLPVYIHQLDEVFLKDPSKNLSVFFKIPYTFSSKNIKLVKDKDVIKLSSISLKVIHTPGHTPGSISLLMEKEKISFTGDTLFSSGIGRTDFPDGSEEKILKSIKEKLFILPDETIIYPGHGSSSTIGEEKKNFDF